MDEKQVMEQSVETKAMMAEMLRQHDRENKRLWCAVMALCVAVMIMAGCMLWAVQNAQNVANEAILNALNTVAEMEVTTTEETTVAQDTGEGGGNAVYQSGEYATYAESGAE